MLLPKGNNAVFGIKRFMPSSYRVVDVLSSLCWNQTRFHFHSGTESCQCHRPRDPCFSVSHHIKLNHTLTNTFTFNSSKFLHKTGWKCTARPLRWSLWSMRETGFLKSMESLFKTFHQMRYPSLDNNTHVLDHSYTCDILCFKCLS